MGLSSSQARLLNLTQRMHQIEYKAQKLEAEKLQMANESDKVYQTYLDALEQTKVQYKVLTTDGSTTYQDIKSYDDFLKAGYAIDYNGSVYDGQTLVSFSFSTSSGNPAVTTNTTLKPAGTFTAPDPIVAPYTNLTAGNTYFKYSDDTDTYYTDTEITPTTTTLPTLYKQGASEVTTVSNPTGFTKKNNDFAGLCKDAFNCDDTSKLDVEKAITTLINSGKATIVSARKDGTFAKEADSDFNIFETSVATNTGLQEVDDTINLKKAEAQYEADMKKIDAKDAKYDRDISALETERNAIKTEMETLKTVAKDNVERTFKLFS